MPSPSSTPRVPSYRRHKPTGQAVVTLAGKDHYLGRYGTRASRAEYDRLIGEWLAGGRCLARDDGLTVAELCLAYWRHAKGYYRVKPRGSRGAIERVRLALRPLRESYGPTPVASAVPFPPFPPSPLPYPFSSCSPPFPLL